MKMAVVCAAMVMVSSVAPVSHAFTVTKLTILGGHLPPADGNHEDITSDALLDPTIRSTTVVKRTGMNVSFSYKAIREIQDANRETDSTYVTTEWVHFDNAQGGTSSAMLKQLKDGVVDLARKGDYVSARFVLGWALHTLQDFYAHSNWIEEHGSVANPDMGVREFSTATSDSTCDAFGYNVGSGLTTAYFWYEQSVTGAATYWTNPYTLVGFSWPDNHCIHGSSTTPSSDLKGAGINKDSSVRRGFTAAKAAATKSTVEYVKLILASLGDSDNDICGLLGQERSQACAGGPKSASLSVPGVFAGWVGLPATITLADLSPRSISNFQLFGNSGTCGTGERGAPLFSASLPLGASLYGAVTALGVPYQASGPGINRRNCSSFVATASVPHPTDPAQAPRMRVWINGTGRGQSFGGVAIPDWESQVRFDSGDPFTGADKRCVGGTVPNSGFFGQAWSISGCSFELKY